MSTIKIGLKVFRFEESPDYPMNYFAVKRIDRGARQNSIS